MRTYMNNPQFLLTAKDDRPLDLAIVLKCASDLPLDVKIVRALERVYE